MKSMGRILADVAWFGSILKPSSPMRKKFSTFPKALVMALGVLLAISAQGLAQVDTGDVIGTVSDPSGAVVPNVKLTITNTDTHVSQTATSDARGDYAFNQIRGGKYSLTAEVAGFQRTTIPDITLLVDQRLRQDITLQVGAVTKSVTVQASSVMLDTDSTNIGAVVESKAITDMPLNGRNYLQLAELSPGVLPIVTGTQSDATTYFGRTDQVIGVAGTRENETGYYLDGIDVKNGWYGPSTLAPSPDAIQEFKIERTAFSVEFGNVGSVINSTIKSGTDTLHGSLYEFDRNNIFDSRNFFNPGALPSLKLNQFGATIGGPIKKDKLFYFGNYEGFREIQGTTAYGIYPTAAERAGTFPSAITSTLTVNGETTATSYGNTIPVADWSKVGTNYLTYIPAPNTSFGADNYVTTEFNDTSWNQVNAKVDYNISSRNSLFVRYSFATDAYGAAGLAPLSGSNYPEKDHNIALHWTHTLSPTTINELRGGYNYSFGGIYRDGAFGPDIAESVLGLQNIPNRGTNFGIPATSFTGFNSIGPPQSQVSTSNYFQATDALNMVRGRHTIKVGGEFRQYIYTLDEDSQPPTVTFGTQYTGNSFANVLLGLPFSFEDALGTPFARMRYFTYDFFAEDTIKLTPRLTLDLGLRYDYSEPSQDTDNIEEVFDWITGTYIHPGTDGITTGIVFPDHRNFGPRAGIAWRPFGTKTSVRASYGIYYLPEDWNYDDNKVLTPDNYPKYLYSGTSSSPPLSPTNVPYTLDQVFPSGVSILPVLSGTSEDPFNRTAYMEAFGLTIEHQITPSLLLEIAYDGSEAHHETQRTAFNPGAPDPTGTIPIQNRVPYPTYSGGLIANMHQGNTKYNSLTFRAEKRYSNGLAFIASYSYARTMDDGTPDSASEYAYTIRPQYARATYDVPQRLVLSQVYALPVGHGMHFMSNSSKLLDGFLGGWEVSGIETFQNGIGLTPANAAAINIGGRFAVVPDRSGPVNNPSLRKNIRNHPGVAVGPYFTTTDLYSQVGNVQGNAGRDFIICPGLNQWDLSLFKNFKLYERSRLQFRSDFFNAWNHTQFGTPNVTVGNGSIGDITSAREARDIQFSLKLTF